MGCDIYIVVQVKKADIWEDVPLTADEEHIKDAPRDYTLFSRLAGVRGTLEPIASPRGIPEGFQCAGLDPLPGWFQDNPTHGDKYIGDHSHSWLTCEEIGKGLTVNDIHDCPSLIHFFWELDWLAAKNNVPQTNVRIVFGFDS